VLWYAVDWTERDETWLSRRERAAPVPSPGAGRRMWYSRCSGAVVVRGSAGTERGGEEGRRRREAKGEQGLENKLGADCFSMASPSEGDRTRPVQLEYDDNTSLERRTAFERAKSVNLHRGASVDPVFGSLA
jgi:hypothetical protein